MSDQQNDGGLFYDATIRDYLVGQALVGTAGMAGVGDENMYFIKARRFVDRAEIIADEYLRRRKERADARSQE